MPDFWDDDDVAIRPTFQALRSLCVHDGDFQPRLPTLDEDNPFAPYMDPIKGLPFDGSHEGSAYFFAAASAADSAATTKRFKKDKPPPKFKYRKRPVGPAQQLESEMWAARLRFYGEWQLDVIPACADGLPMQFGYHLFRYIDHKEQAPVHRQAAGHKAHRVPGCGQSFFVDFGLFDRRLRTSVGRMTARIASSRHMTGSTATLLSSTSIHILVGSSCVSRKIPRSRKCPRTSKYSA